MTPFRTPGRRPSRANLWSHTEGLTLIELLIVLLIIGVLGAVSTPALMRARISANEASAIASLRSISSAQVAYSTTCAAGGFAQSLADLGRVPPGASIGFTVPPLTQNGVLKNGYRISVNPEAGAATITAAAATCNGSTQPAMSSFVGGAHPLAIGLTGQRSFAIAQSGEMYVRDDGATIGNTLTGLTLLR